MFAMLSPLLLILCAALSPGTAVAFHGAQGGEDVITATGRRGHIVSIYNLFDGRSHQIQVTRLGPNGSVFWSYQHYDGYVEKAYAAAVDSKGNTFIAGVRRHNDSKYFLLLKYDENGYLANEIMDDRYDCTAVGVQVDGEDNVSVSGVCRSGQSYPARLLRYNNDGGLLWLDEYDGGGRNYVRGMSVDHEGGVSLSVETVYGDYRDGSFATRTVTYDKYGRRLGVR